MESINTDVSGKKYRAGAPLIWEKLQSTSRTGWVMHNIPEPETVAEHTNALIYCAVISRSFCTRA